MANRKKHHHNTDLYEKKLEAIAGRIRKKHGFTWEASVEIATNTMVRFLRRVHRDGGDLEARLSDLLRNRLSPTYFSMWGNCYKRTVWLAKEKRRRSRELPWLEGYEQNVVDRQERTSVFSEQERELICQVHLDYPDGDWKRLLDLLLCQGTEEFRVKTQSKRKYITYRLIKELFGWGKAAYKTQLRALLHDLRREIARRQVEV